MNIFGVTVSKNYRIWFPRYRIRKFIKYIFAIQSLRWKLYYGLIDWFEAFWKIKRFNIWVCPETSSIFCIRGFNVQRPISFNYKSIQSLWHSITLQCKLHSVTSLKTLLYGLIWRFLEDNAFWFLSLSGKFRWVPILLI